MDHVDIYMNYSRATLDSLGGEYEVEAGYGATRDSYLRDNAIDTFFIIPPAHRRKVSINGSKFEGLKTLLNASFSVLAFDDEHTWRSVGSRFDESA